VTISPFSPVGWEGVRVVRAKAVTDQRKLIIERINNVVFMRIK
jgi:hypothetical protein